VNKNNEKLPAVLTMSPTSIIKQRNNKNEKDKTNEDIINDYNND